MSGNEMSMIKKAIIWILFLWALAVAICGLFLIVRGSLEMFPTGEQLEKTQITGWLLLISGVLIDSGITAFVIKKRRSND